MLFCFFCRLLNNLKESSDSKHHRISTSDVHNKYSTFCQSSNYKLYTKYGLGKIIKDIFKGVTIHKTYHKTKSYQVYHGLQWLIKNEGKENTNTFLTFPQILVEGKKFFFHHAPEGGNTVVQFMKDTCEGSRITKEITVNGNKWLVKIAGVVVDLKDVCKLPREPQTRQELHHVFSVLNSVDICRGLTQQKGILNGKVLKWEKGSISKLYVRANNCKGFVPNSARKATSSCCACKLLIKETIVSGKKSPFLHADHTYSVYSNSPFPSSTKRAHDPDSNITTSKVLVMDNEEVEVTDVSDTDSESDEENDKNDPDFDPNEKKSVNKKGPVDGNVDAAVNAIIEQFPSLGKMKTSMFF